MPNLIGKTVLLIEDDKEQSIILVRKLEAEGYKVLASYNGKDGWNRVRYDKPDIIILDIGIPLIDGYTLCSMIKGDNQTKNIPVIVLTAKDMVTDMEKCLELGADTYMAKPFKWERLLATIKNRVQ
jgi:two-component system alkaline phosphatase synthesis response regulator PhoP